MENFICDHNSDLITFLGNLWRPTSRRNLCNLIWIDEKESRDVFSTQFKKDGTSVRFFWHFDENLEIPSANQVTSDFDS